MILSSVTDLDKYKGVDKNLDIAIEHICTGKYRNFLEKNIKSNISIKGKEIFLNIFEYSSSNNESILFENHNLYIDIFLYIDGEEGIVLSDEDNSELITPYDEEKDLSFYKGDITHVIKLKKGMCAIIFPGELHFPKLCIEEGSQITKNVYKVLWKQ